MKTFLPSFVAIISLFFVVGCDLQSSQTADLNTEIDAIADTLSYQELVELKNQNWEVRLRSDDGYYSYAYNNDSLIFVEQKLCDEEGYPVDGVYGLYFQPFEEIPCYYTWFSADNYFSENQQPDFVAKLKDNKIIEILTDTDLRDFSLGEEVNDNFDLTSFKTYKYNSEDKSSNETESGTVNKTESSPRCCCHCNGTGMRMNQHKGTYGECSSCDGTGKDIYEVTGTCDCN
jgi:hypothetical protein